jgi:hypothetical protein
MERPRINRNPGKHWLQPENKKKLTDCIGKSKDLDKNSLTLNTQNFRD